MSKKKVYLFCGAGMSTSMMAAKMQDAADAFDLPVTVGSFSTGDIDKIVETDTPDCILLGPQARFLFRDIADRFGDRIPVSVIDSRDYGTLNGERVLKKALLLIKKKGEGKREAKGVG